MREDVLDHGYVELLDSMGDDLAIVNAARTSFDNEARLHRGTCFTRVSRDGACSCSEQVALTDDLGLSIKDKGLINFLMRERHGTPFEMVEFKFAVKAPIFVMREWHRHRIASINEMSGRYVELEREFYVPARDDVREQKGKAGAYTYERVENDEIAKHVQAMVRVSSDLSFTAYESLLQDGIAKEVARLVLPVNTYSKMVWKTNLRSLLNFLSLRNHEHAQREIREYAQAMEAMAMSVVPCAIAAFEKHGRRAP